jgi:hypothetical protein
MYDDIDSDKWMRRRNSHDDENEVIMLVYNMLEWKWIYGNNDDDLHWGIYYLIQTSTIFQSMFLRNNITANNIKSGNDKVSTVLMSLYTR